MLRIFVNTNFHESAILRYFASTYRLFSVFRGYLFSRIGLLQTFREDLIRKKINNVEKKRKRSQNVHKTSFAPRGCDVIMI